MSRRKHRQAPHLPLNIRRTRKRLRAVHQPTQPIRPKPLHPRHRIRKLAVPLSCIPHKALELLADGGMGSQLGVRGEDQHVLRRLGRLGVVLDVPDTRRTVLRQAFVASRLVEVELVACAVGAQQRSEVCGVETFVEEELE